MRIVGRDKLDEFTGAHTDARPWIENWLRDVGEAVWTKAQDVKARYSSASFLSNNLVIFNVKGNEYRLEITIAYKTSIVVVVWAGTHAEYDKRNKRR
jgi:mRNA interferase HigB